MVPKFEKIIFKNFYIGLDFRVYSLVIFGLGVASPVVFTSKYGTHKISVNKHFTRPAGPK
jgi:hypothetical protein